MDDRHFRAAQNDDWVNPNAPSGGSGPGNSRMPGPFGSGSMVSRVPHVDSPAARFHEWNGSLTTRLNVTRVQAVYEALVKARQYVGSEVLTATGMEIQNVISGIVPSLLMMVGVVAATSALGAVVGGAIGALAFGAGAVPGAAAGATVGFNAGVAVLTWLGLAFLVAYIGKALLDAITLASSAVQAAWDVAGQRDPLRAAVIDKSARDLARSVALVVQGILQGVVAFLLAKGTAAAASRVPELVAQLKASKMGDDFTRWIELNWAALLENPKLRPAQPVPPKAPAKASTPAPAPPPAPKTAAAAPAPGRPVASPAPAPARSFLKPKMKDDAKEPGAVPGAWPISKTNPMPDVPEGFPPISQRDVNTFSSTPKAEVLPEGTKLYRMVGDDSTHAGAFWTRDMPATEAQWRSEAAVKGAWNGDGGYVEYTVPKGGMPAWTGQAAPQPAGEIGYVLKGGGDQVVIPTGSVVPSGAMPSPWTVF